MKLRSAPIRGVVVPALSIVFLASSAVIAFAQGGVGSSRGLPETSGGSNMLEGRIRLPTGRPAGQGIVVTIEGTTISSRTAMTDHDGIFVFRSLPSGEYVVFVDGGTEYEPIRQAVRIQGTAGGGIGNSAQTIAADLHFFPKLDSSKDVVFLGVPPEALNSYKHGIQAARGGNSKKAVEYLKNAVTVHPPFTQAWNELGVQYLRLGEMQKLGEAMEALLKLSPNDARAHLNMGIALYNQKKLPEAEIHLRKAVELNDADPAAHYYLGMTLISAKRFEEAEKELELAIDNGGDNLALAHKYLGGLYMSFKKNQQAAAELEKYLKLDPKAPDAERIKGTIKELRDKP